MTSMPRLVRILIGDGRSDFCCAHAADRVFARAQLIAYCRANAVEFLPFESFTGIRRAIDRSTKPAVANVPVRPSSHVGA